MVYNVFFLWRITLFIKLSSFRLFFFYNKTRVINWILKHRFEVVNSLNTNVFVLLGKSRKQINSLVITRYSLTHIVVTVVEKICICWFFFTLPSNHDFFAEQKTRTNSLALHYDLSSECNNYTRNKLLTDLISGLCTRPRTTRQLPPPPPPEGDNFRSFFFFYF